MATARPRLHNLDLRAIRSDFPILARQVHGKPLVYLDNAATSQKPQSVIGSLVDYYQNHNANIHRGIYTLSEEATLAYETAREKVARFIGAASPQTVIFTRNTTEAINLVAHAWGRAHIRPGDEILLTQMEHHSNLVPWQLLAHEKEATLRFIPVTEEGTLNLSSLDTLLTERTKLLSLVHVSNVLGTVNPVAELTERAHRVGALVLLDGAQSVPHMPVDVTLLDCDFLAFSAHKMLGPTGIGVLYGKREALDGMGPFLGGGDMVMEVWPDRATYKETPWRYEAGTPNIAGAIAFGAAIDYLTALGMERVREHEKELTVYALEALEGIGARVFGPREVEKRGGVLSFWYQDVHPHDLATVLDTEGVAIRAGHHCAQPLMRALEVPATARASFYIYNLPEEVDALVSAMMKAGEFFGHAAH